MIINATRHNQNPSESVSNPVESCERFGTIFPSSESLLSFFQIKMTVRTHGLYKVIVQNYGVVTTQNAITDVEYNYSSRIIDYDIPQNVHDKATYRINIYGIANYMSYVQVIVWGPDSVTLSR